ncbi:MAG: hypothetical protein MJ187_01455 [Alphaproteobacteria bacterium]|nr:hypothetical protein [Alphaproteobacteria bacterium]
MKVLITQTVCNNLKRFNKSYPDVLDKFLDILDNAKLISSPEELRTYLKEYLNSHSETTNRNCEAFYGFNCNGKNLGYRFYYTIKDSILYILNSGDKNTDGNQDADIDLCKNLVKKIDTGNIDCVDLLDFEAYINWPNKKDRLPKGISDKKTLNDSNNQSTITEISGIQTKDKKMNNIENTAEIKIRPDFANKLKDDKKLYRIFVTNLVHDITGNRNTFKKEVLENIENCNSALLKIEYAERTFICVKRNNSFYFLDTTKKQIKNVTKKQYINTYNNTTDENTWLLISEIDKYLDKISQKQEKIDQNTDSEILVSKIFQNLLTDRPKNEQNKVKKRLHNFYTQVLNGKKDKFLKKSFFDVITQYKLYVYNQMAFLCAVVEGKDMLLMYAREKKDVDKRVEAIIKNRATTINTHESVNLSEWLGNNKESKEMIESLSCNPEIINADEHSKKYIIANDGTIIRNDVNTETAPVKQESCAEKDILPVPNLEKATATRMTNKMLEIEELNRQIDWYVKYCTWLTKRLNSMSLSEHQRNIGQKNYELASKKIHELTAAINVKIYEQLKLIAR